MAAVRIQSQAAVRRIVVFPHHPSSIIHLSYPGSGSWLGAGQCAVGSARWATGSRQGTRRFAEIKWSLAVRNAFGLLLADRQTNVKRQYHLCSGTIHLAAILCPVLSTVTRNSRKPFVWISLPDAETITAHRHSQLSCSMIAHLGQSCSNNGIIAVKAVPRACVLFGLWAATMDVS